MPTSIVRLVDRMIDKDPETRLTDLERIVDQLQKHLRGSDLCDLIARVASSERGEEKPPTTSERLRPSSKGFLSRRIPFYVAIAAFVGGVLFGLVFGIVIKVQRADGTWFSLTPPDSSHPAAVQAQTSVQMSRSKLNLKTIGLAFHNFHDAYKMFPASSGTTGTTVSVKDRDRDHPPHSWRVASLPFIGELKLYEEYRRNEPWDSEHNKQLLHKMPKTYRHPSAPDGTTTRSYIGVVGERAALGKTTGRRMRDMTDGTSNTLLVLEVKTSIPWTKPEDLTMGTGNGFLEDLEIPGLESERLLYGMADGSVREMKPIDMEELRKLITIDGGETVRRP